MRDFEELANDGGSGTVLCVVICTTRTEMGRGPDQMEMMPLKGKKKEEEEEEEEEIFPSLTVVVALTEEIRRKKNNIHTHSHKMKRNGR
jgi:hypothetical protein